MDRFGSLLVDPPFNPALNMAVDWWLLKTADAPVIRFYRWDQPVVSLGYRQQTSRPTELHDLARNFHLVVRPTGGGYLYHHRDLSYSVVLPDNHELTELGILDSYEVIRDVFAKTLQSLGLIEGSGTGWGSGLRENCLDSAADHEPVSDGSKWMAASQLRHRGRLLQHGSLFWRDPSWPSEFKSRKPFHLHDPDRKTTLEDLRESLIRALTEELLPDSTLNNGDTLIRDWNHILDLTPQFAVSDPDSLPVFDRYSGSSDF